MFENGQNQMRKLLLLAAVLASMSDTARADLTFEQWAKGPPDKRAIYIAGVMETVGVYAEVLGFVDRWAKCLQTLRLSYGDVGEGALALAKTKPELNGQPAPAVLIVYMNQRCGFTVLQK